MASNERGELSKKNPYYIPKYRYYELKYRCLQYKDWEQQYKEAVNFLATNDISKDKVDGGKRRDPVYEAYIKRAEYCNRMDMLKHCIKSLPEYLREPIFEAVTTGKGWQVIQAKYELVCPRDEYFKAYHYFFYIYSYSVDGSHLLW